MNGDWGDVLGGLADMFGLGELVRGSAEGGLESYLEGRSTQTASGEVPYVYERVLTRPRDPGVNDR